MNQFNLLGQRRFLPLFVTQFLGALNDNLLKTTLVLLVTYSWGAQAGYDPAVLVPLCNGLFILPFFLFSATAGQLADKYDKAWLIRYIKLIEIAAMALAALGFATANVELLMAVLFLMGLQSTFFGPLKYAILPEALSTPELVGGNGLIEAGTFVAILVGTIAAGLLLDLGPVGISSVLVGLSVLGWASSFAIPRTKPAEPTLKLRLNPLTETWRIVEFARADKTVFLSILGASWFWFYGATVITILPVWTSAELHADASVVTLFLTIFCLGIGAGSLLCERLARQRIELALVPLGSIGMSLFAVDLLLATSGAAGLGGTAAADWHLFVSTLGGLRVLADLLMISVFAGMYIVPLFALIQDRAEPSQRSRVIAANNIINAAFMVGSAVLVLGLNRLGIGGATTFAILALANAAVALYIYNLIPEFLLRLIVWVLVHSVYRLRTFGTDKLPESGPVVIVANHVTFVDGLIVSAAMRRHVRFVMDHNYAHLPVLRYFVDKGGVIPIAPRRENEQVLAQAYETIAAALENNEVVCIFPEGKLTSDGEIAAFRAGIENIVKRTPAPILPMALQGLWGSMFSRDPARRGRFLPRRLWSKITLTAGELVPPGEVSAPALEKIVKGLRGAVR